MQGWYLAVQPQEYEHDEEEAGPQLGQGHHGHGLGEGDEGQAGPCGDTNPLLEGGGLPGRCVCVCGPCICLCMRCVQLGVHTLKCACVPTHV